MSKFTVHTIESAPEASKPAMQKLKDSVGLIPNLAAVMANAPALIEAFVAVRAAYQSGSLSAIEREVVSITNAVANNCVYCVAAHSTFAQMANTPPDALAALRAGKSPADPRLKALSDFSRNLTTARGQIGEADLERFIAAGFTAAQALEVVVGGAVSLLANYTNHLAHAPLDEFLQPQAWKASA
ncbi:MAG TPA: peroxidase-related enzyme [Blastocatellia bacterium]|nr:peroxidase-related enzyme [Blastocatellia bacterium]